MGDATFNSAKHRSRCKQTEALLRPLRRARHERIDWAAAFPSPEEARRVLGAVARSYRPTPEEDLEALADMFAVNPEAIGTIGALAKKLRHDLERRARAGTTGYVAANQAQQNGSTT